MNRFNSLKQPPRRHSKHSTNTTHSIRNAAFQRDSPRDSPQNALLQFRSMRRECVSPDHHTYPFLFKSCAAFRGIKEGEQLHNDVVKHGFNGNVYVQNSLIHLYGVCGNASNARKVLDEMPQRTIVSWNSVIRACIENSEFKYGVKIFSEMMGCGFEPDETTMVALLSGCVELGSLSFGKWVHCQVLKKGLILNSHLGTSLVDMYAKCGVLGYAKLVFDRMSRRNVWTWSAMILGLARHGFAKEALELFSGLRRENIEPNYVTFLGVLCACSHVGLVEEAYFYFNEMERRHGIKPMLTHYGAMVDVLGRAERVEEAYSFIMNRKIDHDPVVWRTLLSSCHIHDVDDRDGIMKKAKERLMELEPRRSGNYVMISNMYVDAGMREKALNLRQLVSDIGLKKPGGESCIEVGGSIHRFVSGDDTCIEHEDICKLLGGLNLHMNITKFDLIFDVF